MPGFPIIDCLYSMESFSLERNPGARELTREMDCAAMDRVLLTPCRRWRCEKHWGPDGISLADVNAMVTAMPQRFTGMASYSPFAIAESLALIELAVENGYCGVYVQTEGFETGLADSRMVPLYRKCQALGIPVIIQAGVSMSQIAAIDDLSAVAEDYGELKIIAGICGAIDLPTTLQLCERFSNVYFAFDGSLLLPDDVRRFRHSEIAWQRAMFGSNGCRWLDLIDGFARIELPYDFMRAFMHDNAATIFQLEDVAQAQMQTLATK
jgi:predicted TIM-barrel fold metal-dependent hydrolase